MDMSASGGAEQLFQSLSHVYRGFLRGTCPRLMGGDVVKVIMSGVCGREHGKASWEISCSSMTLLEKITSGVLLHKLPADVSAGWEEILKALLEETDLMSQLVQQLHAEDQLVSHLAAKTVSRCVLYLLKKSGMWSPVWQKTCIQVFSSCPPGPAVDACLWSLIEVFKRLLTGPSQETVRNLVAVFDGSIMVLCSKLLPEEKRERTLDIFTFTKSWTTTFCLFLDLLEALTMSSISCEAEVCLRSQRIALIHSSALLTVISYCSEVFIRKKILLFLKKVLLQKVGDDWFPRDGMSFRLRYKSLSSDMSLLTRHVLQAVTAGCLQRIQTEPAASFGGAQHILVDEGPKPDGVMLRALSLVLLKSIELQLQAEVDGTTDVCGHLHSLWGFLRRSYASQVEVTHLCCWISLLFGDQDDDLMEAASSFLSIFLISRRSLGLDCSAMSEVACVSGYNPHCHFVLLLQSISFDHSILLDFLISSETCFLKYFVRYLKVLTGDWQGFSAACGCKPTSHVDGKDEFTVCAHSSHLRPNVEDSVLHTRVGLVEYDSSDESEESETTYEGPAECAIRKKTSVPLWSESSSLLSHHMCTDVMGQRTCGTLDRALLCLSELGQVVKRLQQKKLFPYNPSSLLKLLAEVQDCFHQLNRCETLQAPT
ncbi:protein Lines homolog 1 [Nothobranchius furzeri]|uniref:Lines homolog n=2 Tax=Nothobranchius TaxID=28779 RepID=A0A1A7ZFA3_NOTFU|nr:protein Lines-like protein 1-like [Nothobranchius furzeri]KAF7199442.1 protein Lines-like protein 1-like [Nothobranchius furzeri]